MYSIPSAVNLQVFLRLTKYFFFAMSHLRGGRRGRFGALPLLVPLRGLLFRPPLLHLAGALHLAVKVQVEVAQHLVGHTQPVLQRFHDSAGTLVLPEKVEALALVLDRVGEVPLAPDVLLDDRRALLGEQLLQLAEEGLAILVWQAGGI